MNSTKGAQAGLYEGAEKVYSIELASSEVGEATAMDFLHCSFYGFL